jgi:hypothetical protein
MSSGKEYNAVEEEADCWTLINPPSSLQSFIKFPDGLKKIRSGILMDFFCLRIDSLHRRSKASRQLAFRRHFSVHPINKQISFRCVCPFDGINYCGNIESTSDGLFSLF